MKHKIKNLFELIKEKSKSFREKVNQNDFVQKTVIEIKSFVTETIKIVQELFRHQGWNNKKIFLKETIQEMNQTRKRIFMGMGTLFFLLFLLFIGIFFYPKGERIKRSDALDLGLKGPVKMVLSYECYRLRNYDSFDEVPDITMGDCKKHTEKNYYRAFSTMKMFDKYGNQVASKYYLFKGYYREHKIDEIIEIKYNRDGNLSQIREESSVRGKENTTSYSYDEKRNLIKIESKYLMTSGQCLESEGIEEAYDTTTISYKYDNMNRIIEEKLNDGSSGGEDCVYEGYIKTQRYDNQENLEEKEITDDGDYGNGSNSKTSFNKEITVESYKRKVNYKEGKKFYSNEKLNRKIIYKYDKEGSLIQKIRTSYGDKKETEIINYKLKYEYDSEGNLKEKKEYGTDDNLDQTTFYNSLGNIVRQIEYDSDGSIKKRHIYKNDSYGNWIQKITYIERGENKGRVYHSDRTISYFPFDSSLQIADRTREKRSFFAGLFLGVKRIFAGSGLNSLEELNLKGNIKTLETRTHRAKNKFGNIIKGKFTTGSGGTFENNFNIVFDEENRLLEKTYYNPNGSLGKKYIYEYNERNQRNHANEYNKKGSLSAKYNYSYDEDGNRNQTSWYNQNGNLAGKYIYKYDENRNRIESSFYNSKGSFREKKIYKYNEKNQRIETLWYKFNGSLIRKETYKYNEKGDKIEINQYNKNSSLKKKFVYNYEYDKQGNWIKKIKYEMKNAVQKPKLIVEREITYF